MPPPLSPSPESSLTPSSLYVALYLRTDPPTPNDFHWALYHHLSPHTGGIKHHIRNEGSGHWIPDHSPTVNIMKELLLVGLLRIAQVPEEMGREGLERAVGMFDGGLNGGEVGMTMTCRVWVVKVLGVLRGEGLFGDVVVDLGELEREVKGWGNGQAMGASANVQPRPVGELGLCFGK
ncbi:hypothetical protein FQN50_003533 [Emmonsiellopsis sp. PD_5]|nr:hypothetical protein FQN50_003533 [Emmonsiellopsis sp. PD_5]